MPSVDDFLAELKNFSSVRTPIRFRLKTDLSQVHLCGYVSDVSGQTVEIETEPMDGPLFRVSLKCIDLISVEEKGFDIAILDELRKLFDELEPQDRGKLWAKRFERAWFVQFRSGASCVVEKVAQ